MNGETLKSIEYIKSIIEKKCTFVCDRGYDANIYYEYFLKEECNDDFIIRLTEKRKLMFKGKSKKASEIAVKRKGNWMRSKNFFVRCLKMGYINIALHLGNLIDRKNTLNVDFYYGSQWWTLSYECAKEIYDILLKGEYIDYYKGSLVPDESIFQTIYMNSRFKDKYYDKLTYVNWKGQINHPKTFTIEDCDELEKVNYLMARRFDEDFDDKIINKLYDEL